MKNQKRKAQKPQVASDNEVEAGRDVSNNIIVSGKGNVVNVGRKKALPSDSSKKKNKKLNTTIVVAIIGLFGTIVAALISSPLFERFVNETSFLQIDPYMGLYPKDKVSTAPVPTNQMPDSKLLSEISNPENLLTPSSGVLDEEVVRAVIETEVKAASERNILALESIYALNAVVINRNKTPYDSSDDLIYTGWDNIRQLHYVNLFKTLNWQPPIYLVGLQIKISNDKATGTHRGLVSNNTYFEDYSIYTLEKVNGKWLIVQLEYGNLGKP